MKKNHKSLLWMAGIAAVVLLISQAVDVELILEDGSVESKDAVSAGHLYEGSEMRCPSNGRVLVRRLQEYAEAGDKRCFVLSIKEAHFSTPDVRDDVARYLAALAKSYYSDDKEQLVVMREVYSRMEVLNYVTPYALRKDLIVDVGAVRSDVLREIKSANMETRRTALAVLSYFRDDHDIQIFIDMLREGGDEDLVMAMAALVHNCSPAAKKAISEGLQYGNVRRYLTRYRDKETITGLIKSECPVEPQKSENESNKK